MRAGYKRCGRCKEEKPHSAFSKDRARHDGLQNRCRVCRSEHQAERYVPSPRRGRTVRVTASRKWLTPAERLEAFWSKVERGSEDACWPWTGNRSKEGYGRMAVKGKKALAHQIAWRTQHQRPIPAGMDVHHSCGNKLCCNPKHLEALTRDQHTDAHYPHLALGLCPHGHTDRYKNSHGKWVCRVCHREKQRRRRHPPVT